MDAFSALVNQQNVFQDTIFVGYDLPYSTSLQYWNRVDSIQS